MVKKICIIGAGIGGLATGALLSNKGYKIAVFEKEKMLGGRSLAFNGDSLTLENYRKTLSKFQQKQPGSFRNRGCITKFVGPPGFFWRIPDPSRVK